MSELSVVLVVVVVYLKKQSATVVLLFARDSDRDKNIKLQECSYTIW